MPPAIAGSGICVISSLPASASTATHSAENTPASGELAPASRFSPERVKEPADSVPENHGPIRLDSPCARTS
ncbi:hypothetical protein D9M71_328790 [compost metagenome]